MDAPTTTLPMAQLKTRTARDGATGGAVSREDQERHADWRLAATLAQQYPDLTGTEAGKEDGAKNLFTKRGVSEGEDGVEAGAMTVGASATHKHAELPQHDSGVDHEPEHVTEVASSADPIAAGILYELSQPGEKTGKKRPRVKVTAQGKKAATAAAAGPGVGRIMVPEDGEPRPPKERVNPHRRWTPEELVILHEAYAENAYPSAEKIAELREQLGVVKVVTKGYIKRGNAGYCRVEQFFTNKRVGRCTYNDVKGYAGTGGNEGEGTERKPRAKRPRVEPTEQHPMETGHEMPDTTVSAAVSAVVGVPEPGVGVRGDEDIDVLSTQPGAAKRRKLN